MVKVDYINMRMRTKANPVDCIVRPKFIGCAGKDKWPQSLKFSILGEIASTLLLGLFRSKK